MRKAQVEQKEKGFPLRQKAEGQAARSCAGFILHGIKRQMDKAPSNPVLNPSYSDLAILQVTNVSNH